MKKTDAETEQRVINLYLQGNSCKSVADLTGINSVTVFNILNRNNIPTRTNGGINSLPIEKIVSDYNSGIRVIDIAKQYNVDARTIYNYLEKANVDRNYIYINRSLNRNYFDRLDSYDKAYFIGLLITDGSVVGNAVSISLKCSDDYILNVLSEKIGNENPLYYDNRGMATLHFKSKELVQSLARYGIVPRKTLISYLPILLNFELMSHLIRGMIDGDGWISYKSHSIGFCAGHESIVRQFRDYLISILQIYPVAIIPCNNGTFMVNWSSKRDIATIGNFIYSNKMDCYLPRKYENYSQICIHDNTEITN